MRAGIEEKGVELVVLPELFGPWDIKADDKQNRDGAIFVNDAVLHKPPPVLSKKTFQHCGLYRRRHTKKPMRSLKNGVDKCLHFSTKNKKDLPNLHLKGYNKDRFDLLVFLKGS
nr:hypothetical protein [Bacillus licheniformis]